MPDEPFDQINKVMQQHRRQQFEKLPQRAQEVRELMERKQANQDIDPTRDPLYEAATKTHMGRRYDEIANQTPMPDESNNIIRGARSKAVMLDVNCSQIELSQEEPDQRKMLESAHASAREHGFKPASHDGQIGSFVGMPVVVQPVQLSREVEEACEALGLKILDALSDGWEGSNQLLKMIRPPIRDLAHAIIAQVREEMNQKA